MKEIVELQGGLQVRRELTFDLFGIPLQAGCTAGHVSLEVAGSSLTAPDGVVDPLTTEWVQQTGGIADQQDVAVRKRRSRPTDGKGVATYPPEAGRIKPVAAGEGIEASSERGTGVIPAAYPNVEVITLGKEPAI